MNKFQRTIAKMFSHAWLGTFFSNGLILLLNLITGILLARLLLPEGRGILAVILYWSHFFAGYGGLSLNEATAYRASLFQTHADVVRATSFWLAILIATVIIFCGYPLLPILLGEERSQWVTLSQFYLVLFVPATLIATNLLGVDQGCQNFAWFNLLRILDPLVYLIAILSMSTLNEVTVTSMTYATLAGILVSAILRTLLSAKSLLTTWPKWNEAKKLLVIGSRFHFSNLLLYTSTEIDRFIIILLADDYSLGLYIVALTVANGGFGVITQAFTTLLFPKVSAATEKTEQRRLIIKSLQFSSLLLVMSNLFLAIITPWLIPLLFGHSYLPAVPPTLLLLLAFTTKGMKKVMMYGLRGLGKTREGNFSEMLGLVVFILSVKPLFSLWGLLGVGLALAIANMVAMLYLSHYLRLLLNISISDWWGIRIATIQQIFREVKKISS
jgi:O-antigen/teichoic acid export membrane protein